MAVILRPRHVLGLWHRPDGTLVPNEQRTLDVLKEHQRAHLARNPAAHKPQVMTEVKRAYVGNGAWRVRCRCGEATHADPEWRTAVCFGCGAVWPVVFPEDWKDIEELLAKRPVQGQRNWQHPETYHDLVLEQIEHGDPT